MPASRISVGKRAAHALAAWAPPWPSKTAKRHSQLEGFSASGREGPLTTSGRSSKRPGRPWALMLGAGPSGRPSQISTSQASA